MEDGKKKEVPSPTEDSRTLFRVIDGKTGEQKLVQTENGKVLTKPEPRPHIKTLPYLHPDEYW